MPTLTYACLIYSDGSSLPPPPEGFELYPLAELPIPDGGVPLQGPYVSSAHRGIAQAKAAHLLVGKRTTTREATRFFGDAHAAVQTLAQDRQGWALDVLRLWPFPLDEAASLPAEPLGEDLFSISFTHHGPVWHAETHGLAKLDQREVLLQFKDDALREEAAIFCAHLADYVVSQSRRVAHGQALSFGYDQVSFRAAEGPESKQDLREFLPAFVRKVLPASAFPGVGRLDVLGEDGTPLGLTAALKTSHEQRLLLDDLGVVGESPHQAARAYHCDCVGEGGRIVAARMDPTSSKDSGWTFTCANLHPSSDLRESSLKDVVQVVPGVLKYLALPPGSTVRVAGEQVEVETLDEDFDEE